MKKTPPPKKTNKVLFTGKDPRGKIAVCEEGAIAHAQESHPEVTYDKIKESIAAPTYIRQSIKSETTQLYFVSGVSSSNIGFYTIVDFDKSITKGRVKTAYEGRESSTKGEIIWHPK